MHFTKHSRVLQKIDKFAVEYANWDKADKFYITVDVDFAPEYMIDYVLKTLEKYDVSATFFATHESEILKKLSHESKFEVGIHPNLGPESTQGKGLNEIVKKLRSFYPRAVGTRFHLLNYSYRDLIELGKDGFIYDISSIRFNCPYVLPAWHQDLNMVLLTYGWEDGVCEKAKLPMKLDSIDLKSPGIKIFNFHPVNVFLNGKDSSTKMKFLSSIDRLTDCPEDLVEKFRCNGNEGADIVLNDLLKFISSNNHKTLRIKDLVNSYKLFLDIH